MQEGFKNIFLYLDNDIVAGVDQADCARNVAAFLQMTKGKNVTLNPPKSIYSVAVIDILIASSHILNDYGHCRNIHLLQVFRLYLEPRHVCILCEMDFTVFR